MEIKKLIPRGGEDVLRIGDSNDLVVMENFGHLPQGKIMLEEHGLFVFCTEGMAQFDYDGQTVQLRKNDLFFYMSQSVAENFMASVDFNCFQLWVTRNAAWNSNMYGKMNLSDLVSLKQRPKVTLSEAEADLLVSYFQLLCRQMRDKEELLYEAIVRGLASTLLMKVISLLRRGHSMADLSEGTLSQHGKQLADRFVKLLVQSDGRNRKVEYYANQLNVTPKYLSTLLRGTINRRPSKLIAFYTLNAIERRLRFTDMTMQQIANELQFPNASFFGKYYKEHTGMTPLEYRKKFQK